MIDSRRKKPQKRKTSCVLHHSESDGRWKWYGGETPWDLTKPRIAPYKNTWKRLQNTVCWCNLKLAQEKCLQFYQTRSHAVVLYNTLPSASIEKAVCMKTQEELYQKSSLNSKSVTGCTQIELAMRSTRSTMPRRKIILGPIKRFEELRGNLEQHCGLQNFWSTSFCSRAAEYNTWEQGQEVGREVREPPAQGIFPSGLETDAEDQQVQQRIAGIDRRQKQHRDLRTLRFFSKQQCPVCNTYWEIGIIYCSCGRNMKSSHSPTDFEQNNYDVTSIPGYVIKKNGSRGAKHGPSERQRMYCWAKQMLKKKAVRKSTEATQRYLRDGTPAQRTGLRCH